MFSRDIHFAVQSATSRTLRVKLKGIILYGVIVRHELMSARESQAAWLDRMMNPSLTEVRIARMRVDRLSRNNKELKCTIDYHNDQISELLQKAERLQEINFMLASIIRLTPQTVGSHNVSDAH